MPLIKSRSQKAFSKNVETEMKHGKPQDQALAVVYETKRRSGRKKYAKGGGVLSAKYESRPDPDDTDKDAAMVSRNSGNKALRDSQATDNPTVRQAQKPSRTALSEPGMVNSMVIKAKSIDALGRLKDQERHMMDSMAPDGYGDQPGTWMDEEGANRQGPKVPDMERQHSNKRMPYAKGGPVMQPEDHMIELRERNDEEHLLEGASPSEDEGESNAKSRNEEHPNRQGPLVSDMERQHYNGRKPYAQGGDVSEESMFDQQPTEEADEMHHASIAAAIMAKKERMKAILDSGSMDEDEAVRYYEGGQVEGSDEGEADLDLNSMEQPNAYYKRNEDEVLKENYASDIHDADHPEDSNLFDDPREDDTSDPHDMVDAIRKKMRSKRQR